MDFINEQDAGGVLDLFDYLLEAFFELAAIHRPRHQRPDIERQHPFVEQQLWHVAFHDALRQALDDRRFADAWFADESRVVLGAPT